MRTMQPIPRSLMHAGGFVAALAVVWVVSLWVDNPAHLSGYVHELVLDIGIAVSLAVSLNLILGIAGQFSLGHAGFVAVGAYTAILVSGRWFGPLLVFLTQHPFHFSVATGFTLISVLAMAAGAVVAAVMGLAVGVPTLRLRGDYLAIATLGFGEILAVIIQNNDYLGGATGLSLTSMRQIWMSDQGDLPAPNQALIDSVQAYMDNPPYFMGFFLVGAVAVVTVYIVHNIKYATAGRALLALREDPIASESVGVPTTRYKVAAFVIGAALAGLAGGLVAHHKSLLNPESFRFMRSVELVAMVILGGQGSITGSILAAIVLTALPELLRTYVPAEVMSAETIEKWRMVFYSLFLILAMLFRPKGLFGRYEIMDLWRWAVRRGRAAEAPVREAGGEIKQRARPAVSADAALLSANGVTMQFGGLRALEDFSLDLRAGEVVGLIGPNGAGKTTAFNLLTGVYKPTRGEVRVAARTTRFLKPHGISKRGVARTFQNIRLFGNLSVLDNVQIAQHAHHKQGIPAAILRTPAFFREEAVSRSSAMELLALFHLEHLAEARANSLSYGDQRRLEIARALATRPRVLLLDEPTAGMNPTEKRTLMTLIRELRDRFNLAVLLIEHDMKVVMGVCERIVVLDYGRTIARGNPAEIRANPAVIAAYLGAPQQ